MSLFWPIEYGINNPSHRFWVQRDCTREALSTFEVKWSRSVVSNSLQPYGLLPARLLHPWEFPGKNNGVGCHFLLQGTFPTQGLNPGFPHCRQTPYTLNHQGSHFRIWTSRKGQDCREWSWRQDRIGSGEPWMIFNVFPMWGKEKNNVDRRWSIVDCDSNNPSKMMLSGL